MNAVTPGTEQPTIFSLQIQWDAINNVIRLSNQIQPETDEEKAITLAIRRAESGAWLHALPSRIIGTLMYNKTSLRLGLDICVAHMRLWCKS